MPTHSGHILRPGATIYIAGPMTGYPLYNFPAFDTAFIQLKALGYNPISPADIDRQHGYDPAVDLEKNFPSKEDCVTRDVAAIVKSDCVVLMPGWETSKGSNMEKCVAEFLGRPVFLYDPKRPGIFITPSPHADQAACFRTSTTATHERRNPKSNSRQRGGIKPLLAL